MTANEPLGTGKEHRRRYGVFDTPEWLALQVVRHAATLLSEPPRTVLDPAAGDGVFLSAARQVWPDARLAAFELDVARGRRAREHGAALLGGDFLKAVPKPEYDLVIGNPPWVSYSGRQAQAPPDTMPGEKGWPALHSSFLLLASQWLRPGCWMVMLVPAAVAYQAGYRPVRERLARSGTLQWWHEVPQGGFRGVTVPYTLLLWHAAGSPKERCVLQRPLPPGAFIFGDPGVHTGNAADLLLRSEPAPGLSAIRVGRDVMPFQLHEPNLWLDAHAKLPAGRYARFRVPAYYESVPIVLRQTASRPVAACHRPPAMFRNSVLACYGMPGHEPEFLVGVLNSRVAAVLYRLMNPDARQRVFPQIKVGGLARLPIVRCETGAQSDSEGLRLAEMWLRRKLSAR